MKSECTYLFNILFLILKDNTIEMAQFFQAQYVCVSWIYAKLELVPHLNEYFCTGDILGRALRNLDGLLKMPYGCGEQNMALLAPNIYILQYLKGTQQLTATIKEKASNFLTSGESH